MKHCCQVNTANLIGWLKVVSAVVVVVSRMFMQGEKLEMKIFFSQKWNDRQNKSLQLTPVQ